MGRIYFVSTGFVNHTAADDMLEIRAGANTPFFLRQVVISQNSDYGDAKAGAAEIALQRGVGSTQGTGGTAPTVAKLDDGDAAAALSATLNATTDASGGTITTIYEEAMNLQGGFLYQPEPDLRPYFGPGESLIIRLTDTVGGDGDANFAVVATVEEL